MIVITGVMSVADIVAAPKSPANRPRSELFQRCWRSAELCCIVSGDWIWLSDNVRVTECHANSSTHFPRRACTFSFFCRLVFISPLSIFGLMRVADTSRQTAAGPSEGLPIVGLRILTRLFFLISNLWIALSLTPQGQSVTRHSSNKQYSGVSVGDTGHVSDAFAMAGLDKAGIVVKKFKLGHNSDVKRLVLQFTLSPCLPHPS